MKPRVLEQAEQNNQLAFITVLGVQLRAQR